MNDPLLSILIPTVPGRLLKLMPLYDELNSQIDGQRAEILYLGDNRTRSIGLKRNALLQVARGKYVAFCDDDDTVARDYIATLLDMAKVDVDVLTFRQKAKWNDAETEIEFRINHPILAPFRNGCITKRFPWQVCAWRRELAQDCVFTDKNYGEDYDWVCQANELVRTEAHNPKLLHFYTHKDETSLSQR
jgi:glycosyltransferase involved in cell wall biosynthesis